MFHIKIQYFTFYKSLLRKWYIITIHFILVFDVFVCFYKNYLYSFKCCLFCVVSTLMPFFDVNSQTNVICVKELPVGPKIVEVWRGGA